MTIPCKIVQLPDALRDLYKTLINNQNEAANQLSKFRQQLLDSYGPPTRQYAPFETVEMEILVGDEVTHAYFTKSLAR